MDDTPTILIVEDDHSIGRLLSEIFTLGGYRVEVAPTGAAAARALSAGRPDLIALDLNLPDISGQALLEGLREQPDTAALPVVVITSQLPVAGRVHAQAEAVVAKPFDLDQLLATVQQVVPPADPRVDFR
ncbi:MAG TPA: response regulator [Chloroflexaceae bacterium]|nr:response regulator [Chloroflexaceae bacterium]